MLPRSQSDRNNKYYHEDHLVPYIVKQKSKKQEHIADCPHLQYCLFI